MSEKKRTLLIIEDDLSLQKQMRWAFDTYETVVACDFDSAVAAFRRYEPAVVTMDFGLPPDPDGTTEGFKTLEKLLSLSPDVKVIVLTGQHDRSNAVKAIGMGAYDFFAKPFEPDLLLLTIDRAFRLYDLQQENHRLSMQSSNNPLSGVISISPEMQKVARTVEKVAATNVTVMLLGESGTGKEVLAHALHNLSPRKDERFIAINCAAIPENLLESELFGYERGAFTGAVKQTPGKIELANKGTLFLDEIGDLPSSLQAKLLRFLQQRVFERVGGRQEISIDVRVICATHQNIKACTGDGRFREDLYYRLAEIVIDIPPLRTRQGDAALLAHAFVQRFASEMNKGAVTLRQDALDLIDRYPWPGNVRELENCIKRAVIMADNNQISAADLGLPQAEAEDVSFNLRQIREEAERSAIVRVLARVSGNVVKAAELLGISRPTLYDMMHRYGLK